MKKLKNIPLELVCRILAPLLSAAFYVFLVIVALLLVAMPIIALAGASAAEMLLPPFMSEAEGGYTISLGNGIEMFVDAAGVDAGNIKESIYLTFIMWMADLIVCMPIARFISRLCANMRDANLFDKRNALYVKYTGFTIIVGGVLLSVLKRYFNFRLVEIFAANFGSVSFAVGIDIMPILTGLTVVLLGMIYARICRENGETYLPEKV